MKLTTIVILGFALVGGAILYLISMNRGGFSAPSESRDTEIGPARGVEAAEAAVGALAHEVAAVKNGVSAVFMETQVIEGQASALGNAIDANQTQQVRFQQNAMNALEVIWQNQQAIPNVHTGVVIDPEGGKGITVYVPTDSGAWALRNTWYPGQGNSLTAQAAVK